MGNERKDKRLMTPGAGGGFAGAAGEGSGEENGEGTIRISDDVIAAIQRLIAAGAKQQTGDAADLLLASQTLLKLAQQSVETAKPPAA